MNPGGSGEKRYGLIIPSKGNKNSLLSTVVPEVKKTVFAAESDSDDGLEQDEGSLDWRSRTTSRAVERSMQRNQARQAALKALEEDPTVFQYDEIYETMEQQKEQEKPKKVEKKPKYIANLLRTAEQRKVENERRVERMVQKEREAEGDMFRDKEAFVTPAYRAKLAELKKAEEEERKKEQLEAILDVRKQQDMSGFYRHLFKQKFATEKDDAAPPEDKVHQQTDSTGTKPEKMQRQYRRQREESQSPPRPVPPKAAPETTTEQQDDSDHFSEDEKKPARDSTVNKRVEASAALVQARDKEAEDYVTNKQTREGTEKTKHKKDRKRRTSESPARDSERRDRKKRHRSKTPEPAEKEKENEEPKKKIDIWKKRTVDDVYETALERYLARKEARESGAERWPSQ